MSIRIKLLIQGVASLVILALMIATAIWSVGELHRTNALVDHTNVVLLKLELSRRKLVEAEATARAYYITGQERHLENFDEVVDGAVQASQEVIELVRDNPEQLRRAMALADLFAFRRGRLQERVQSRRTGDGQTDAVKRIDDAFATNDAIDQIIGEMGQTERALLDSRMGANTRAVQLLTGVLVAGGIFNVVILIWGFWSIMKESRKREQAQLRSDLLNQHLHVVNQDMGTFSYSVSHDLRAPLRAIDGFSGILSDDYGPVLGPEGNRVLQVIRSNVQQMGRLVDDLLAFSRLGRQPVKSQLVQTKRLVESTLEMLKTDYENRVVDFRIESLPDCTGDASMIRQVWQNLISNAVKFTRGTNPAVITIGGEVQSNMIRYYISDNGVGFDMQYQEKLFQIFQRLHTTDEFEGTGIGLAIVRRIIEKHGGIVSAEGQLGVGATIFFTLPSSPQLRSNG